MPINLNSYTSVETGLFVRIQVDEYSTSSGGPYTAQVLKFSDYIRPITIDSESYTGLGQLVGITASSSELTSSSQTITITISGIPDASISEIINSKIKGSPVKIWRVFFNPTTGQQLSIAGNPYGRFTGIVNNYSLEEEYDYDNKISSNRITLVCSSIIDVLNNKFSGRRTNPIDQKLLYPSDVSFDRVPNLSESNYNFGAPT